MFQKTQPVFYFTQNKACDLFFAGAKTDLLEGGDCILNG